MLFGDYDLEKLVGQNHPLRKIKKIISFEKLAYLIKDCSSELGRNGYGLEIGVKSLFLQFYLDLSDREFEDRLRYDLSLRWFCGISLEEQTPDHTFLCRMRTKIGTKRLGKIFKKMNDAAQRAGYIGNVFSFVDATAIKAKESTWEQRDKAIEEGEDKLNNENVARYSADPDARFGCKGKDKFWYGYKRHTCADTKQGLITKVAVTPANVTDQEGFRHICPDQGMALGDKAYCLNPAQSEMKARRVHSGAILKNNMKKKNKEKDRFLTRLRMPFEGIFSKQESTSRYRRLVKVQMQAFLEAIVHNIKRLVVIGSPPLFQGA